MRTELNRSKLRTVSTSGEPCSGMAAGLGTKAVGHPEARDTSFHIPCPAAANTPRVPLACH